MVGTDTTSGCTEKMLDSTVVIVNPLPVIGLAGLDSCYALDDPPVLLVGTPTDLNITGSGVTGNTFNPAEAGLGQHTIYYSYIDMNGCKSLDSFVVAQPCISANKLPDSINSIQVFPKPNAGEFWIQFELSQSRAMQISFYNPMGQLLWREYHQIPDGQSEILVEKTALLPGLHTLVITAESGEVRVEKIPVLR